MENLKLLLIGRCIREVTPNVFGENADIDIRVTPQEFPVWNHPCVPANSQETITAYA
jgi:hypothetical protein